jgi:hypothetical protein
VKIHECLQVVEGAPQIGLHHQSYIFRKLGFQPAKQVNFKVHASGIFHVDTNKISMSSGAGYDFTDISIAGLGIDEQAEHGGFDRIVAVDAGSLGDLDEGQVLVSVFLASSRFWMNSPRISMVVLIPSAFRDRQADMASSTVSPAI